MPSKRKTTQRSPHLQTPRTNRLRSILGHMETAELAGVAGALAAIRKAVVMEMGPDYGSGHEHPPQGGSTGRN